MEFDRGSYVCMHVKRRTHVTAQDTQVTVPGHGELLKPCTYPSIPSSPLQLDMGMHTCPGSHPHGEITTWRLFLSQYWLCPGQDRSVPCSLGWSTPIFQIQTSVASLLVPVPALVKHRPSMLNFMEPRHKRLGLSVWGKRVGQHMHQE
jgi:hypothetical protein